VDAAGGGILDGAIKVFTTPLFARIALFVFLANIVGTFFYLEQARLVASTIQDSAQRVEFFSGRDLAVSIATFLIEVFGTARVLQRFGVTVALLALPVTAAVGALLLSFDAALWVSGREIQGAELHRHRGVPGRRCDVGLALREPWRRAGICRRRDGCRRYATGPCLDLDCAAPWRRST
jgi:ATP/ADP translocase